MALKGKKKVFADAVLSGKSNKEAAIAAGYSAKTASPAGSRLVKDKEVAAYLKSGREPAVSAPAYVENGFKTEAAPPNWPFGREKPPEPEAPKRLTGEEYLQEVVNDRDQDVKFRLEAAKKLIEYEKGKPAPMGKKEAKAEAAKKVAGSRFAAGRAPLALVKH